MVDAQLLKSCDRNSHAGSIPAPGTIYLGKPLMDQIQIADRNIKLYIFIRIFAKRVFLPLSAIFFIENAGFSILDIGLLSAFYSVVQLVAEVPTGYFADKIGRVASIRLGALSCIFATLCYVIFQHKTGIFAGTFFEALGYSFLGGAGEALIHDSLVAKKIEHNYTKYMSKTMSLSLIANAILVSLVPMTYAFNPRYPFMIGTLAYGLLYLSTLYMHDLNRVASRREFNFSQFGQIIGRKNILIFGLTFGIISALYTSSVDMINVAMKDYGIRPDLLGWVFGLSSVAGALIGPLIHYLRRISLSSYLILDTSILLSVFLAAFSRNGYLLAFIMIASISIWRYRKIIYQSYLLQIFPTSYKATLISSMNNLEQLNSIWLPIMITFFITHSSIPHGFGYLFLFTLCIAPIFYLSSLKFFTRAQSHTSS